MELVNHADYQDLLEALVTDAVIRLRQRDSMLYAPRSERLEQLSGLLTEARQQAVRTIHTLLVQTYWQIGRRIVEEEQGGSERAGYGERLLAQLAKDLTHRFGRGFSQHNLKPMRQFYLRFPPPPISETLYRESQIPDSQGSEHRAGGGVPDPAARRGGAGKGARAHPQGPGGQGREQARGAVRVEGEEVVVTRLVSQISWG